MSQATVSQYLNFVAGENTAWLTGVQFVQATNDKRAYINLRFSSQPTAVSHEAPGTRVSVYLAKEEDEPKTQILFNKKIKTLLYPLAELPPESKTSIGSLYKTVKGHLETSDIQCKLIVEKREGKGADRNGNPIEFDEVVFLEPLSVGDKAAYESDIAYDDVSDLT